MIAKIIDVELRAGHADAFHRAQDVWNRESRRCEGYLGEYVAALSDSRVVVIAFWTARRIYEEWMADEHDRIARLAGSEAHYDSLTVTIVDSDHLTGPAGLE